MRFSKFNDEQGSATIDFIAFGLVTSVAILMSHQLLSDLQHRQFIAQQISKQVVRTTVLANSPDSASFVFGQLLDTYGIDPKQVSLRITCEPECKDLANLVPASIVEVTAAFEGATATNRLRAQR